MIKPMLAATLKLKDEVIFPIFASPKLDGVRALIINGVVMSRTLKPIPNRHVQKLFGKRQYNGFDGELIVGPTTDPHVFRTTTSGVMTIGGEPDVKFCVFDDFAVGVTTTNMFRDGAVLTTRSGYGDRYKSVMHRTWSLHTKNVTPVIHSVMRDMNELMEYEIDKLNLGYEGVMLRHPQGPYKYGRSTVKEHYLLKLKRFSDNEALVIGAEEEMHNANESTTNELGQKSRSSHKAGKVGKKSLGALCVVDIKTGVQFKIGAGFTTAEREMIWRLHEVDCQNGLGWIANPIEHFKKNKGYLLGRLVKYKHQVVGEVDKPRFPTFNGFRDPIDL